MFPFSLLPARFLFDEPGLIILCTGGLGQLYGGRFLFDRGLAVVDWLSLDPTV